MINDKLDNEKKYILDILHNVSVYLKNTDFKSRGVLMKCAEFVRPETARLLGIFDVEPSFLMNIVLALRVLDISETKTRLVLAMLEELDDRGVLLLTANSRKNLMRKAKYTNQTVKNNLKIFNRKGLIRKIANNHYEFNRGIFGLSSYKFMKATAKYRLEVGIEDENISIKTNLSR